MSENKCVSVLHTHRFHTHQIFLKHRKPVSKPSPVRCVVGFVCTNGLLSKNILKSTVNLFIKLQILKRERRGRKKEKGKKNMSDTFTSDGLETLTRSGVTGFHQWNLQSCWSHPGTVLCSVKHTPKLTSAAGGCPFVRLFAHRVHGRSVKKEHCVTMNKEQS